nr:uncharacterized protein LOC117277328 [Nicotiana tomentosiformis]
MVLPSRSGSYTAYCDASRVGIGCVLIQDGRGISYDSRQLKPHEKNYQVHDVELEYIVHALKIWRNYLYNVSCKVFTDHRSLQHLLGQKDLKLSFSATGFFLRERGGSLAFAMKKGPGPRLSWSLLFALAKGKPHSRSLGWASLHDYESPVAFAKDIFGPGKFCLRDREGIVAIAKKDHWVEAILKRGT